MTNTKPVHHHTNWTDTKAWLAEPAHELSILDVTFYNISKRMLDH